MRRQIVPINSGIMLYGLCLIAASLFFTPSQAALNVLVSPDNIKCACSGDVLTFTCTIVGGGNTLWRGSAFDCDSTSDEIILRHSTFGSTGTSGTCNSGTIVGRSVRVEGTCFTSQLSVTVSESLNSRAVQCDYNSNTGTRNIGSAILNVVSASNPYPPPNDVSLTDCDEGQVTFNWTSVSSSCPTIDYVITSDCGVCLSSTNTTTVTCSDLQLPTQSDNYVCSFNVSSRVCGIVGNHTTAILTAAVPDVPRVLSIVPLYANESQSLKRLTLTIDTTNNTRISTNDLSGSIKEYNVTYSKRSTLVNSTIIPAESLSCEDELCNFTVTISSSFCSSSSDINVTVSAANRIGQGPSSDTAIIDCTNMFVQVNFNSSTSIFSCEFLNKFDNSMKSCKIVYGLCNQELINKVEEKSTPGNPNIVLLDLPDLKGQVYCYTVTTNSNISTIRIEGKLEAAKVRVKSDNLALILAIAIPVVIISLCLTSILVIVLFAIVTKRKNGGLEIIPVSYSQLQATASDPLELQLKPVEKKRDIVVYKVDENCELRGFMKKILKGSEVHSWRGCVYYELTEEKEDISDDKELILMKKNTEELYTPENDKETLHKIGLLGEGISQPSSETPIGSQYRVFVQSKGSGRRHLRTGTLLLFEKEKYSEKLYEAQFLPIPEDYFVVQNITEETTIKDIFKTHILGINKSNIFIEFDKSQVERKDVRDVLLLDKEKEKLFTGPCTRQMIKENSVIDLQKWSVFVLRTSDKRFKLKKGMTVVYENPKNVTGTFRLLEVDEDNVRMSEFVKRKLEINEFERGRAYFEFTKKEDLPCCRKVIRMPGGKIQQAKESFQELQATIETFYTISGAPGDEISPPESRDFIHSPTMGSRCLKKETLLLYRVKESEVDVPAKEQIKNTTQTVKSVVNKSEEDKTALSDSKQDSSQARLVNSEHEHAQLKQVGIDAQPMAGSQAKDHKQVKENLPQVKAHDRKETSVDTPKDGSTATVSGTKSGSA